MRTTVTLPPAPATPEFRAPRPILAEPQAPNKFSLHYKANPLFLTPPLSFPPLSGPNTQFFQRSQAFPHYLREVEGALRSLDRATTQLEIAHAIEEEIKKPFSQSCPTEIESGSWPHLTNTSRMLLAKFFKVHPGYLVDGPEGYSTELISDLGVLEDRLDLWLVSGAANGSGGHNSGSQKSTSDPSLPSPNLTALRT